MGDLDNDGDLEILVVNLHNRPSLLKNRAAKSNSILIRALTKEGRDAIGARVTVTYGGERQLDEVRSGGYHISQGDFRVHFGVGQARQVDLTVRWPQGKVDHFSKVSSAQQIVIQEGKGIVDIRKFTP